MFDSAAKTWLANLLGQGVKFDEPMARHTAFRIGGPADAMAKPQNREQLKALVQWARQNNVAYTLMGGGTNMLVKDGGIRGVVIGLDEMANTIEWKEKGTQVWVTAGAGVPTRRLCAMALREGWQGMNMALGIPGSLGGAIMMNAGTQHGAITDVLTAITLLTGSGREQRLATDQFKGEYRHMQIGFETVTGSSEAPVILMDAELALAKGKREEIFRHARRIMRARVTKQPTWQPSAGCFFKNPSPDTPAGRLIDQAGLKGERSGDAVVSRRHANFIVNRGHATAEDVMALVHKIQSTVSKQFGVQLEMEVRIVGEEAHA